MMLLETFENIAHKNTTRSKFSAILKMNEKWSENS